VPRRRSSRFKAFKKSLKRFVARLPRVKRGAPLLALGVVALVVTGGFLLMRGGAPPPVVRARAAEAQAPAPRAQAAPAAPSGDVAASGDPIAQVLRRDDLVAAAPAPRAVPRAIPGAPSDGRPLIAIIIDDMGVDRARTRRAAALPAPITFAFLPYAPDVGQQAATARRAGHEIMLHMPMEPEGREDPGPQALLTSLAGEESRRRLAAQLERLGPVAGANNHMGSRFTADRGAMQPVLAELASRGLYFIDSRTTAATVATDMARAAGIPAASRDVFLDNETVAAAVRARLAEAETIARRRGAAIAIGHPHDATLAAIAAWLPEARVRGFALVPASAVVRMRMASPAG
jgi:polysaccharide deacetylase 2 family uncharacterized protein YibQ